MGKRKAFRIPADKIKTIVKGLGGCIATDRITVDGEPVRYMVREEPSRPEDSGWMFMSGTESQEYMDDPANFEVYDVNTIANYDPDIVPFLRAPAGSSFERRNNEGPLVPCDGGEVPEDDSAPSWPPPGFPVVEDEHALTKTWALTLPAPFARRIEAGSLVLWRPGITCWINAWNNDKRESREQRVADLKQRASRDAREQREDARDGLVQLTYRLTEDDVESLTVLSVAAPGHLQMSIYFDHEGDVEVARAIAASVRFTA